MPSVKKRKKVEGSQDQKNATGGSAVQERDTDNRTSSMGTSDLSDDEDRLRKIQIVIAAAAQSIAVTNAAIMFMYDSD